MAKIELNNKRAEDLVALQKTLYSSKNYTRRRLHNTRFNWVRNAIQLCHKKTQHLLAAEYGPGSGIYLPILCEYFDKVVAADIEKAYLDDLTPLLTSLEKLSISVDDIQQSKFPLNNFDLILCTEVLEHVANPEQALKGIFGLLKPGGMAIITTPQRYSIMEICCKFAFLPGIIHLVRAIYREPILEMGHISLRTNDQIQSSINQLGFKVLEEEIFGLYIPLISEFGGDAGGKLIEYIEKKIINTPLSFLLWTQCYVVQKPINGD